jgi:BASS family bile acid:Na+ symporter
MIELGPLARLASYLFLVSAMLGIGLEVTGRQILQALRDPGLVGRALVANVVLVPLLGLVLVRLVPMSPDVAAGLLILAAAPGAPFAVHFTARVKGGTAIAAALLFLFTLVSLLVTAPLAGLLVGSETPLQLPARRLVASAVLLLLVPLLAGFALQRWVGGLARAARRPVHLCAAVAFPVVMLLTMGMKSSATRTLGVPALVAILLLVAGGMLVGWLLGGPEPSTRLVLATSTSMRNAVVALLIALASFPDSDVDLAVLAFSALMVPPNLLLTAFHNRRLRRAGSAPVAPARLRR